MPEPGEHDLLLLPLEFLRRSLEHLCAGDELLGGKIRPYLFQLLLDFLSQFPITDE
jgi:hypothetical protein